MPLLSILRVVHIAIGVLAFILLPVPLLTRKGSKRHVSFGRVYVWAMWALAATGIPLAARALFADGWGPRANALFLFFVALLASETAWMGVRALRARRGDSATSRLDGVLPSLLLACSIAVGALGLARGVALHGFLGALG